MFNQSQLTLLMHRQKFTFVALLCVCFPLTHAFLCDDSENTVTSLDNSIFTVSGLTYFIFNTSSIDGATVVSFSSTSALIVIGGRNSCPTDETAELSLQSYTFQRATFTLPVSGYFVLAIDSPESTFTVTFLNVTGQHQPVDDVTFQAGALGDFSEKHDYSFTTTSLGYHLRFQIEGSVDLYIKFGSPIIDPNDADYFQDNLELAYRSIDIDPCNTATPGTWYITIYPRNMGSYDTYRLTTTLKTVRINENVLPFSTPVNSQIGPNQEKDFPYTVPYLGFITYIVTVTQLDGPNGALEVEPRTQTEGCPIAPLRQSEPMVTSYVQRVPLSTGVLRVYTSPGINETISFRVNLQYVPGTEMIPPPRNSFHLITIWLTETYSFFFDSDQEGFVLTVSNPPYSPVWMENQEANSVSGYISNNSSSQLKVISIDQCNYGNASGVWKLSTRSTTTTRIYVQFERRTTNTTLTSRLINGTDSFQDTISENEIKYYRVPLESTGQNLFVRITDDDTINQLDLFTSTTCGVPNDRLPIDGVDGIYRLREKTLYRGTYVVMVRYTGSTLTSYHVSIELQPENYAESLFEDTNSYTGSQISVNDLRTYHYRFDSATPFNYTLDINLETGSSTVSLRKGDSFESSIVVTNNIFIFESNLYENWVSTCLSFPIAGTYWIVISNQQGTTAYWTISKQSTVVDDGPTQVNFNQNYVTDLASDEYVSYAIDVQNSAMFRVKILDMSPEFWNVLVFFHSNICDRNGDQYQVIDEDGNFDFIYGPSKSIIVTMVPILTNTTIDFSIELLPSIIDISENVTYQGVFPRPNVGDKPVFRISGGTGFQIDTTGVYMKEGMVPEGSYEEDFEIWGSMSYESCRPTNNTWYFLPFMTDITYHLNVILIYGGDTPAVPIVPGTIENVVVSASQPKDYYYIPTIYSSDPSPNSIVLQIVIESDEPVRIHGDLYNCLNFPNFRDWSTGEYRSIRYLHYSLTNSIYFLTIATESLAELSVEFELVQNLHELTLNETILGYSATSYMLSSIYYFKVNVSAHIVNLWASYSNQYFIGINRIPTADDYDISPWGSWGNMEISSRAVQEGYEYFNVRHCADATDTTFYIMLQAWSGDTSWEINVLDDSESTAPIDLSNGNWVNGFYSDEDDDDDYYSVRIDTPRQVRVIMITNDLHDFFIEGSNYVCPTSSKFHYRSLTTYWNGTVYAYEAVFYATSERYSILVPWLYSSYSIRSDITGNPVDISDQGTYIGYGSGMSAVDPLIYYSIDFTHFELYVHDQFVKVYLRRGELPTTTKYDIYTEGYAITITQNPMVNCGIGKWYVGVQGANLGWFTITASQSNPTPPETVTYLDQDQNVTLPVAIRSYYWSNFTYQNFTNVPTYAVFEVDDSIVPYTFRVRDGSICPMGNNNEEYQFTYQLSLPTTAPTQSLFYPIGSVKQVVSFNTNNSSGSFIARLYEASRLSLPVALNRNNQAILLPSHPVYFSVPISQRNVNIVFSSTVDVEIYIARDNIPTPTFFEYSITNVSISNTSFEFCDLDGTSNLYIGFFVNAETYIHLIVSNDDNHNCPVIPTTTGTTGSTGTLCPTSAPFRCKGQCVSTLLQCIGNCTGTLNPYQCSNGTCSTAPLQCRSSNCSSGFECWNGECVSVASQCRTLPACPRLTKRCFGGNCIAPNQNCSVIPSCASYACPDGNCAINRFACAPFDGCSVALPVQCADGTCAATLNDCLCPNGQTRCAGGNCAASCPINPNTLKPIEVTITVDEGQSEIELVSESTLQKLGKISIPQGTFTRITTITIRPIPDSELRNTTIGTTFDDQIDQFVSTAVEIIIESDIDEPFTTLVEITLLISSIGEPTANICIARLNEQTGVWRCLDIGTEIRFNAELGGYIAVSYTDRFSKYSALLSSSNNEEQKDEEEEKEDGADNTFFLIVGTVVAAVLIIAIILFIGIRYFRKQNQEIEQSLTINSKSASRFTDNS